VPDILRQVLAGMPVATSFELQEQYLARDNYVQYRETDFEFVSRLMEEEGIFSFFRHDDGGHSFVLTDGPPASSVGTFTVDRRAASRAATAPPSSGWCSSRLQRLRATASGRPSLGRSIRRESHPTRRGDRSQWRRWRRLDSLPAHH
jgi:hypothetical protein